MTYRERREQRAERLREWADKRKTTAAAVFKSHEKYRGDHAFNFQPGHIPERARVIAAEEREFASMDKAAEMGSKAGEIDRQLDNAIYSDDPDAQDALRERIEGLEVQRERIKAVNVAARKYKKGGIEAFQAALVARKLGEVELTDTEAVTLARSPMKWGDAGPFSPGYDAYVLQNLGGNIARQKKRLAQLERDGGPPAKMITVRYGGECADCGKPVEQGVQAIYQRPELRHYECWKGETA